MKHVDVDAVAEDAFGLAEDYPPFASSWHSHARHQILFSAKGTLLFSTSERRWTLPPERAAWIPAGTKHKVESKSGVELRTVYVKPKLLAGPRDCRVFAVTPLAREMFVHSPNVKPGSRTAFFEALAALAKEWLEDEQPYYLPAAKSDALARALRYVEENLEAATISGAAKAARLSERTLARRFEEETQSTFRDYLQGARMMKAMDLLARPNATVSTVAHEVGFASIGAFSSAFTARCGETPSAYRARTKS